MPLHLVLDIETIPDSDVPFTPKPWKVGRDVEFHTEMQIWDANPIGPPPHQQIVCIGICVLDNFMPKVMKCVSVDNLDLSSTTHSERDQIVSFITYFEKYKPVIVTLNGRSFDMPVILTRAMKYGLTFPTWFTSRDTRYRFSDKGHIDVMDQIADFGSATKSSVDHLAHLVGLPGKMDGADGSMVEGMMLQGRLADVRSYCLSDVFQETVIFLRWELLRGVISREKYWDAMLGMREIVETTPLPKPFREALDWKKFSLTPEPKIDILSPDGVILKLADT